MLPEVKLIDSGRAIARRVHELLSLDSMDVVTAQDSFAYCTLLNHHAGALGVAMEQRGLGVIKELTIG